MIACSTCGDGLPELMPGPASVHGGLEATRAEGAGDNGGVMYKVKDAVDKIT